MLARCLSKANVKLGQLQRCFSLFDEDYRFKNNQVFLIINNALLTETWRLFLLQIFGAKNNLDWHYGFSWQRVQYRRFRSEQYTKLFAIVTFVFYVLMFVCPFVI